MQIQQLARASAKLVATRSRLTKTAILAECLAELGPDEVHAATSYLTGRLPHGPIGIGPATIRAATVEPSGRSTLKVTAVDAALRAIAAHRGAGAQARRAQALRELLARATAEEQHFLLNLLLGELRQGALEGVASDAVARAARIDAAAVRRAVMLSGDLAAVAARALSDGHAALADFSLQLFRPLQPMLAQPIDGADEVLANRGDTAFEYKLDGARVQVHRDGGQVRVFTRHLNDVTAAVPEIVEAALALRADRVVLDGEAIALGRDGRPLPFQTTLKRFGRRQKVAELCARIPLSVRLFDCLHLDGEDLIDADYRERMQRLDATVDVAMRVPRLVTSQPARAIDFLRQAIAAGHEGLMAKSLQSSYQAGSRGADWHKIKPVHTLDLVVLAAEWGSGRRRGRLSNLHLGARDAQSGEFVMLGKTFKGLTDAMLDWQTRNLLARAIDQDEQTVYVRPELVVEVAFNELQRSQHYPAGLALRFARIKRYRDDKNALGADTLDTVRRLHETGLRGLVG
jgi:DNA ligase-1